MVDLFLSEIEGGGIQQKRIPGMTTIEKKRVVSWMKREKERESITKIYHFLKNIVGGGLISMICIFKDIFMKRMKRFQAENAGYVIAVGKGKRKSKEKSKG